MILLVVKFLENFLVGNRQAHDSYWNLRVLLIRSLGAMYLVVFLIVGFQGQALWGAHGLLPIQSYAKEIINETQGKFAAFYELPSLFYFFDSDAMIQCISVIGVLLSVVMILGYANFPVLLVPWLFQLSLVNLGQLFYGYGWEMQILELTFLCFFLVPVFNPNLKRTNFPPARVAIWAIRFELFRLMLGAGLIKMRGDSCWRDLSCLMYHYETQPNPNPLSWVYHHMPAWFHMGGALFNHFVELVVPFGILGPKNIRRIAGVLTLAFQAILISSGNLAWLNWLTLLMCISCFDDEFLNRLGSFFFLHEKALRVRKPHLAMLVFFFGMICLLSVAPVLNLFSAHQAMNTSYNEWHLVNSYGAFGSVGREREEVIIEGTDDPVVSDSSVWKPYEFHCAPGDIHRMPCLISPYHYHLDWQIWFSGMRPKLEEEWLFRLVVRLLQNDQAVTALFRINPFEGHAPRWIRMQLYRYEFSDWKDWPKDWWKRELISPYMKPVSLEDPLAQEYL
jgi:Lipase maturation factor